MTIAREAAGQPTGGQFAATAKAGAAVSLTTTQEWAAEDDHRLTELEDMDIEAAKAGRAMSMAHQAELIGLREKYLGSRNRAAQGDSLTAPTYEYRGISASVTDDQWGGKQIKMSGHDEDVDVEAYVGDMVKPYPAHLPGEITGVDVGYAKHHDGKAVTFTWEDDDSNSHSVVLEDLGGVGETYFQVMDDRSDLPPMTDEQRDEFDEWATEAAEGANVTIEIVEESAARSHRIAASRALTGLFAKEKDH